jgi:hypothetical protein
VLAALEPLPRPQEAPAPPIPAATFEIPAEPAVEAVVDIAASDAPLAAPIGRPHARTARKRVSLTPLLAAAAVGVAGTLAVGLVIGFRPPHPTAVMAPSRPSAPTVAAPALGAIPPAPTTAEPPVAVASAAAPVPKAPRRLLARAAGPPHLTAVADPEPAASPALAPAAAAPALPALSTQIQLPSARPVGSLAEPAATPPAAAAPAPVYVPRGAPDPNAPMPTHRPDGDEAGA